MSLVCPSSTANDLVLLSGYIGTNRVLVDLNPFSVAVAKAQYQDRGSAASKTEESGHVVPSVA